MKLIVLLSSLLLTGCFATKGVVLPEKVNIDPRALEACAPLKPLVIPADDPDPFVPVLENVKDNALLYSDCARKQNNSIKLLKSLGGIKDSK